MSYTATSILILVSWVIVWRHGFRYGREHPKGQAAPAAPQRRPATARTARPQARAQAGVGPAEIDAAVSALANLGYSRQDSRKAVESQLSLAEGLSGEAATAALVQAVLRQVGRGKAQRIEPGETP